MAKIYKSSSSSTKTRLSKRKRKTKTKILDPQGPFLQRWNKVCLVACIIAVASDHLFFYIPVVDNTQKCLDLDRALAITASILRSSTDLFYIFHIIFQFRTGFIAPNGHVFGIGELVVDKSTIAKRYLLSFFFIDIIAVLPLPQVITLTNIPITREMKGIFMTLILAQYVPRMLRIYPLCKELTTSGVFTQTPWAGAAFYLFFYMLASNVVGALWYVMSIDRQYECWWLTCNKHEHCEKDYLFCGHKPKGNFSFLNTACPLLEPEDLKPGDFDFGIFLDALQSPMLEKTSFRPKFLYSFWWGLRNLSSIGQNLKTSYYEGEILFAILISVIGLILFTLLIGNMQKYMQSNTVRVEEMRMKSIMDAEQWMSHRMLPGDLRDRIRRYEHYRWKETRGIAEESFILNLPKDLRRDVKRHLCYYLLKIVPMFEKMDEQLMDAMCDQLKPILYTEMSYIVREGDPVDKMIFFRQGTLSTIKSDYINKFNNDVLKAGDFCGEELLTWALDPRSSSSLPISTRTVQAVTDVEPFALMTNFLKFFASQYRHGLRTKQLRHTFRFYSQQWRTWAAYFIQEAWRRHCRNKLEKSLREVEDRLQDALAKEGESLPSLGATIYASRFATTMLRTVRRNHPIRMANLSPRVPPLLLQKPVEPDFGTEDCS